LLPSMSQMQAVHSKSDRNRGQADALGRHRSCKRILSVRCVRRGKISENNSSVRR